MGEANHGNTVQSNFCKQSDENNANLFLRFSPENPNQTQLPNSEPQVDLCLRLSLGAVDSEYWKEKHLTRSSSVAGMVNKKVNDGKSNSDLPELFLSLTRSCSLPLENEKGQIKLKDWQAKKRMEAKQRMVEKQRRDRAARQEENPSAEAAAVAVPPPPKSEDAARAVASAARSPVPCRAIVNVKMKEYGSAKRKREVHDFQGGRDEDIAAAKDAVNSQSLPNPKETEPVIQLSERKLVDPPKKVGVSKGCFEDNGIDVMKQMPSVTTTGDGPNGRRIEGFLYRYKKGEITIVCVCHGCFLSPGEFVKHAGGKDVANPMKLINVVPSF